jgi:hypothetical protein
LCDTGNNDGSLTRFNLVRFPEPRVPQSPAVLEVIQGAEVFWFRYPNNQNHDAETLLIDPLDGTPYVLVKQNSNTGLLYRYPMPLDATQDKVLTEVLRQANMPASFSGGDVSQDGRHIVIRNPNWVYEYLRDPSQPFERALTGVPCVLSGNNQGLAEGISFSGDGSSLLATSEGAGANIWRALVFPSPSVPMAAAWGFGSGFGGTTFGWPGLGIERPPLLGVAPLSYGVFLGRPQSACILVLSMNSLPDGIVPLAGGWAHVFPDLFLQLILNQQGSAQLPIGIVPDHPVLYGFRLYGQAFVQDPTAPQGLALSRGLTVRFDR